MALSVRWTSHLNGEAKERFTNQVISSEPVLNRLLRLVEQSEKAEEARRLSSAAYEDVNWAQKQADSVGYLRALKEIKQLLHIEG